MRTRPRTLTPERSAWAAGHVGLIPYAASPFLKKHPHQACEILSAAMVGFCKAAIDYEEDRAQFSTLACTYIQTEIMNELRSMVPQGYRTPHKTGLGAGDAPPIVSLQSWIEEDSLVAPADPDDESNQWEWFCALCAGMKPERIEILWQTVVEGKTSAEVGQTFGLTDRQVAIHKHSSLRTLRRRLKPRKEAG